jgi:hypothetical protein
MIKVIELGTEEFGEPSVKVIDDWTGEGLVKAAADSQVSNFVSKLAPEDGKVYVHILAMGAGEAYSANRNADFFPEENLVQYHKTFETSPAHIFRNHVNKDPSIAIGKVVFSTYNPRMRRVEVVAWIDKEKGADIVQRLERGEFPATSMACKTPYDVCSICGNKAHTRQEYCEHLTTDLGRIYPDGRKVMALNVAPLSFFDMSIVVRPADVTSSVLQKVANHGHVTGSAELAEVLGITGFTEKSASLSKLSEFIKKIEGGPVVDHSDYLQTLLDKVKDPGVDVFQHLSKHDLADVLHSLAYLGISPSIGFLADMIGHRLSGDEGVGVGSLVEGYFAEHSPELDMIKEISPDRARVRPELLSVLSEHVKSASLLPDALMSRPVDPSFHVYVPSNNVGYFGNGPHVQESPLEQWRRLTAEQSKHSSGLRDMLKTLIVIGGAALAAKWYITREIERQAKEMQNASHPNVKIVLVKAASDREVTVQLAKLSMAQALKAV